MPLPEEECVSRGRRWKVGGGRGIGTSGGADLDVESVDAEFLASGSDVLGSQHGGVWGRFVTVCLDLHASGDTSDGFAATGITQKVSL